MRDWQAFVRSRLTLPDLTPERETRIVRELAAQVEDFYREAVAAGKSDAEADAYARAQITDWPALARDLQRADGRHRQPGLERLANALETPPSRSPGVFQMLAHVVRDFRFGTRQLVTAPGFSLVAILTLALGIGATTAIFSVVNGVLLRPLPYPQPDGLVRVHEIVPHYGRYSVAPANFLDWRDQNTVFEGVAAYNSTSGTFAWADGPEWIEGTTVSWNLLDLLRVRPALGAGFTAEQDRPGSNNVIVISHALWQRRFNGDPAVVGRAVTVDGAPMTIVGVMPRDFYYPTRTSEFWQPIAINPANAPRGAHFLGVIARLENGVTLESAGAEMKTIAERLSVQYPDNSANESAEVVPLHEHVVGAVRPALTTLLIAVGVVVLIACTNVANLLLVRASVREKEVAIRASLGARPRRLVMQMLSESLVLALVGGALGLLLAYLAIPAVQLLGAGSIPRVADVAIDRTVLSFVLAASVLTGVIFGLVPALQLSRTGVASALKEGGRSSTGAGGRWLRSTLLVGEVALSLMLLVGAALLLRSFANLTRVDPGFDAEGVLAFQISLPPATYPDSARVQQYYNRLLSGLEAAPSVSSAAAVQTLPMRGSYNLAVTIQGQPAPRPGEGHTANYRAITPAYFSTLGIPVLRGRTFSTQDATKSPRVAIVDEAFVQRHYPGEDAVGRRIDIGNGTRGAEIVGVVGSVNYSGLDEIPTPTMYMPVTQDGFFTMWVMARTSLDPASLTGTVREVVRSLDPALPAYSFTPLAAVVDESVAQRRFSMLLILLFGLVALFLAAVGLYGVVSYTVSQRTKEIGLRMAIGAKPRDVLTMILGGGMKLAVAGIAIGVVGALAASRIVESMLFGLDRTDPITYAATTALLLVIAAAACYIPARRALRVDPIAALQQ